MPKCGLSNQLILKNLFFILTDDREKCSTAPFVMNLLNYRTSEYIGL